jgi:hypothetical protein
MEFSESAKTGEALSWTQRNVEAANISPVNHRCQQLNSPRDQFEANINWVCDHSGCSETKLGIGLIGLNRGLSASALQGIVLVWDFSVQPLCSLFLCG